MRVWLVSFLLFAAGAALRLGLDPWVAQSPWLIFILVVATIGLLAGVAQAVAAMLLYAAIAYVMFLPHSATLRQVYINPVVSIATFLATGTFLLNIVAVVHESRRRLEAANRVQEELHRELQHRVANNMQFVSSMLDQTSRFLTDAEARAALDQASGRISNMGKLNRRLSDPAAYAQGVEPVLRDIVTQVLHGTGAELRLDIAHAPLSMDQMTAMVLLVSEAATNAVKHVFAPRLGRVLTVSLTDMPAGQMRLAIADDGPGMAEPPGERRAGHRLGLRIMESLAQQLGGSLRIDGQAGTRLTVDFRPA